MATHGPPEPDPAWQTPAEASGYRSTPDAAATERFLARLASARPDRLRLEEFGRTGEGRPLLAAVASGEGRFDPAGVRRAGRVVLLVQNAIHAGETDGKDASLALLRDLVLSPGTVPLLDRVTLVVLPIYNVDGHERRSPYGRINQNGPEVAGWRANGTNLNLNRDYLKAEAPETRAFFRLFRAWSPDFFVDNHVTDGTDYQYDVTFMLDDTPDVFPATAEWLRAAVAPAIVRHVADGGHAAFPYQIFLKDDSDPARGLVAADNPPRFSTGQMILENRPGLLVEMHMRKPYRVRVAGNYLVLDAVLRRLRDDADRLLDLNRAADVAAARLGDGEPLPLVLTGGGRTVPVEYRGVEFTRSASAVSGATAVRYGDGPWNVTLPMETRDSVALSVRPPRAYLIPPAWTSVIDVLRVHGVTLHRLGAPWTGAVERYRVTGLVWPDRPFEGRFPILRASAVEPAFGRFGTCERRTEESTFPPGSVVAALDQPLSKVIVHWLEPEAPDSAVRWGYFDPIFERKESAEPYVLERLAEEALAGDPALRAAFAQRIATDAAFAASPADRLDYFYRGSPWGLANPVGEYPVVRLRSLSGLPLA